MQALAWQREIYLKGFAGQPPAIPPGAVELEQAAIRKMTPEASAYVRGGAGQGHTVYWLIGRVLVVGRLSRECYVTSKIPI